ncbi:hypothetical protein [Lysobacter enzymogenes]|uniref:hypothetical protein n=1 Tax=Lysobacter enzymogenes TaxID=69 RepID=UPI0008993F8D|nr:hypothetical protein [Lysobacter enzymogenes]SDX61611.1 hypothetical protein SAMN05421681_106287 [Lysobacter enzymogenes]
MNHRNLHRHAACLGPREQDKPRRPRRILAPALLWLASLWAVSAPALAQAPVVEPNVDAVVQAGRWSEAEAGEGSYRVVVVGQGFEHVSTRVLAQWKADGGEDGQARIVHEAELVAPGNYSLTAPKLTPTASGVRVELRGVATYDSRRRVVCRFDLAPGGKVTVMWACGL